MRIPRRIDWIFLTAFFLSTVEGAATKPCDESLIIGFKPAEMLHVGGNKHFTKCNGTGKALRMSTGENVKEITCFDDGKWLYDGKQSGVNSSNSITVVGCFETICDEHKITKGTGVTLGKSPPLTLSCAADHFATIKNVPYKNLTCGDTNWKDEKGEIVMAATASFEVECKAKACHLGLVQLGAGVNRTAESIGCAKPDHELKINSSYHSQLECDKTAGWKDEAGKKIASADEKFTVECVEKTCDLSSFTGVADLKIEAGPPAKMKCDQPTKGMLIGDKIYDELTCVKGKKWREGSKELDSHKFTVSCVVKACHHSFITSIGQDVETSLLNKLSCKSAKNELRINGSDFYGAEFTCDKDKGWMSDGSKVVAKADSIIAVECVEKTCHKSLLNSSNVDQFNFEANETNQFVLSCNEQSKFLYAENAFHKSLECIKHGKWTSLGKNASEQISVECAAKACHDSLVKIEKGVRRESNALTCSNVNEQLHITNSSFYADKLTCNATSGWSDGSTKLKGAEEEFTVECVMKENQNNDVRVCAYNVTKATILEDIKVSKISENSSEVGLSCEPTKSKTERFIQHNDTMFASLHCTEERGWVDHKGDSIGVQADQLMIVQCAEFTSCKEEFPIDTKCDPAWEGCQELQTLEPKPSRCPVNTSIFIRKAGSSKFHSTSAPSKGNLRDEISCNGMAGWTVALVGKRMITGHLGKGDTIICAENNPLSHHEENINSTNTETNSTDTKGVPQSKEKGDSSISEESAMKKTETWMAAHTTLLIIIASAFAGSIILSIMMIVVYKVFVAKQTPTSESDPSREKLVDDKKNKKRMREGHGCNDAILDDQIVEAPAEIKL